jgi:uncharacterized protein (DUF885 family)
MTDLTRREALLAGGATLALASLPAGAAAQPSAPGSTSLLDALAEEYLALSPETATSLGIDTGARAALRRRLSERSAASRAQLATWLRSAVQRIEAAQTAAPDPAARANLTIARTVYQTALDGFAFPFGDISIGGWRNGPYVVAQNMGAYIDTPRFLDAEHRIESAADAEAYLERLAQYPAQLDGETEQLRAARGRGITASDIVLDKTLRALRQTRAGENGESGVVTSIANRTRNIPGDWAARARRIATDQVGPALDRQIAELEEQRRGASADIGMWKFREGPDFYAWALRAATTTTRTPEQIHAQGREELAALHAEMDTVMRQLGATEGTVSERLRRLERDPRYAFPEGDEGRRQIIAFIEGRLADLRPRLPRAFGTLTRGNVEVRRIAPAEEPGAPGAYGGAGSIDGTIPGRFWINLRTTGLHSRISLPSLTYHEAIPGHVWQDEYTLRLPLIRSLMRYGFSAFSEGWALYAEQLAGELGVYENDPAGRLGYLASMAFRAARLVVDTGIHAQRWTRDRALSWFAEATGSTPEDVASEVDRYCVWPGQACAYKVGHTEINRLRNLARGRRGSSFDLRAFNDLLVTGGPRPLTVLASDVNLFAVPRTA